MPHGKHGFPVKMQSVPAGPVRQRSSVSLARAQFAYLVPSPGVRRTFARQLARALVLAIQTKRDCSPRASTAVLAHAAATASAALTAKTAALKKATAMRCDFI